MRNSGYLPPQSGSGSPGPQGAPGPTGKDGVTWTVGNGPPNGQANTNDLYLDELTGDIYRNN